MSETVEEMQKAAQARLPEGEALVALGHWDGGIYLLGYVAEMVLKVAYCRLDPTLSTTTVVKDVFGIAAGQWRGLFRNINLPRNYSHDILFWEVVLSEQRRTQHKPFLAAASPRAALILSRCVQIIGQHWDVEMRYQPPKASEQDALAVRLAVRWIYANQDTLWS